MGINVSIIMPSLNVIRYIEDCINSVLSQTMENIEIICVDAGSTDGTLEIIQKYATMDKRIQVIHSEKKSYGYQINMGIKASHGTYIGIVETDDTIEADMFEQLYSFALKYHVDIVKSDFWGVVGETCEEKKHYHMLEKKEDYHRCLSFQDNYKVLPVDMIATWSGIYRKDFLIQNNIWHNETPGASYQDTGFSMLAFMYSKSIYFTDQCFYHYRMDNPDSSVYAKNKTYCICDEFEFIKNKMEEDSALDEYRDLFCRFFYKKYKRNLERIPKEEIEKFLGKFQNDFRMLLENRWIQWESWEKEEWEDLKLILDTGSKYLQEILERRRSFLQKILSTDGVIIYGAGVWGKRVFQDIADETNVICFAQTNMPEVDRMFMEKPVLAIAQLEQYTDHTTVVIAVKNKVQKKMMRNQAETLGFRKVVELPYGLYDF